MLVEQAVELKAPAVAASALEQYEELGLTLTGVQVQLLAKALGMQGDLDGALRLVAAAVNAGVQTSAAPGAATDSATGDAAVHDSAPASAEAADDVAADAEKEEQGATAASASGVPPGV